MYQVNLLPWRQRRWRRHAIGLAVFLAAELLLALGSASLLAWRWREERLIVGAQLFSLRRQEELVRQRVRERRQCQESCRQLENVARRYRQARAGNRYPGLLLDRLAALLPPEVWLTSVSLRESRLSISGCGRGYAAIKEAGRRLEGNHFPNPLHWREITRLENGALRFRLQGDWPQRTVTDASR